MHEYPVFFFFVLFSVVIFFHSSGGLVFVVLFFFLSSLMADKFFSLFLRKMENPYHDKVFILPLKIKNAYTLGNSILIGKALLQEDEKSLKAILLHEMGHIRFKDYMGVLLLLIFFRLFTAHKTADLALILLYSSLFAWFYYHTEVRADLYAYSHMKEEYLEVLERFNLRWRLNYLRGIEDGKFQEYAIYAFLAFLSGLYLGWLYVKS